MHNVCRALMQKAAFPFFTPVHSRLFERAHEIHITRDGLPDFFTLLFDSATLERFGFDRSDIRRDHVKSRADPCCVGSHFNLLPLSLDGAKVAQRLRVGRIP